MDGNELTASSTRRIGAWGPRENPVHQPKDWNGARSRTERIASFSGTQQRMSQWTLIEPAQKRRDNREGNRLPKQPDRLACGIRA